MSQQALDQQRADTVAREQAKRLATQEQAQRLADARNDARGR